MMPLLEVRRTADKVWRCERWPDGWRVLVHGGLVLQGAHLEQAKVFLALHGVDWDALIVD